MSRNCSPASPGLHVYRLGVALPLCSRQSLNTLTGCPGCAIRKEVIRQFMSSLSALQMDGCVNMSGWIKPYDALLSETFKSWWVAGKSQNWQKEIKQSRNDDLICIEWMLGWLRISLQLQAVNKQTSIMIHSGCFFFSWSQLTNALSAQLCQYLTWTSVLAERVCLANCTSVYMQEIIRLREMTYIFFLTALQQKESRNSAFSVYYIINVVELNVSRLGLRCCVY